MTDDVAVRRAIAAYSRLIERALDAAGALGEHQAQYSGPHRLAFDGDSVVLTWPEIGTNYGDHILATETKLIPMAVMCMTDAQFARWKADIKAAQERRWATEQAERIEARERQERAAYEALKQKYGK